MPAYASLGKRWKEAWHVSIFCWFRCSLCFHFVNVGQRQGCVGAMLPYVMIIQLCNLFWKSPSQETNKPCCNLSRSVVLLASDHRRRLQGISQQWVCGNAWLEECARDQLARGMGLTLGQMGPWDHSLGSTSHSKAFQSFMLFFFPGSWKGDGMLKEMYSVLTINRVAVAVLMGPGNGRSIYGTTNNFDDWIKTQQTCLWGFVNSRIEGIKSTKLKSSMTEALHILVVHMSYQPH